MVRTDCSPPLRMCRIRSAQAHCFERLIDLRASPATQGFDRDGVGGQMVLAPIQIAGTSYRHTLFHRVETSLGLEFLLKGFTPRF